MISVGNRDLESALETLPDEVANAELKWGIKTLDREKIEGLRHLFYKGEDMERTAADVKALVNSDPSRYDACLEELKAKAIYNQKYESLMTKKILAKLRTAY